MSDKNTFLKTKIEVTLEAIFFFFFIYVNIKNIIKIEIDLATITFLIISISDNIIITTSRLLIILL